MTTESAVAETAATDLQVRAREIIERLTLITQNKVACAFEIGRLLLEWENERLYDQFGHKTQDEVFAMVGLKRATAYLNKRIVTIFKQEEVEHLGIGRIRLLAAKHIEDPMKLINEGIEVRGPRGKSTRHKVDELSYRELQQLLKDPDIRKRLKADKAFETRIAKKALKLAAAPILADLGAEETDIEATTESLESENVAPNNPVAPVSSNHGSNSEGSKRRPLASPVLAAAAAVAVAKTQAPKPAGETVGATDATAALNTG